mmetsp:Transcript_1222/g.2959  ORF Transcript_1222/g.2959 Transcript_1222/m.2959 type:complete len:156 (+) Transcript_1222:373-840(+)
MDSLKLQRQVKVQNYKARDFAGANLKEVRTNWQINVFSTGLTSITSPNHVRSFSSFDIGGCTFDCILFGSSWNHNEVVIVSYFLRSLVCLQCLCQKIANGTQGWVWGSFCKLKYSLECLGLWQQVLRAREPPHAGYGCASSLEMLHIEFDRSGFA